MKQSRSSKIEEREYSKSRIKPVHHDDLDYAYHQIALLTKELNQIKRSISWKAIMLLRIKVLDRIVPNRIRLHKTIYRGVYLLKSIRNYLSSTIRPANFMPLIPYTESQHPVDEPMISVIIPCFNYGNFIERAVKSVLAQTFTNYEIIIVEGGSNDGTTKKIVEKIKNDKINTYFRDGSHMVGDNRNYGIDRARGKYICCLDPDDYLDNRYLEKAVNIAECQKYDIVSSGIRTFGSESKLYPQKSHPNLGDMLNGNHIATVALFRRSLYTKYGGYHDWGLGNKHVPEDYDLWVRYIARGARAYNIQEMLMFYRKSSSGSLSSGLGVRSFEKQRKEIIRRNIKDINFTHLQLSKINARLRYISRQHSQNALTSNIKVNVLFALPYTVMGGADKIFTDLVRVLKNNDIQSSIVTTVPFDDSLCDTTKMYLKHTPFVYHLPRFIDDERCWYEYIYEHIKNHHIDTIFLGGSKYFYDNLHRIKRDFPGIKVIDIQFNTDVHFRNNRKNAKYIDLIIAEPKEVYEKYKEEYGVPSDSIRHITYGVDLEEFNPKNRRDPHYPLGIPRGKYVITFMGRLSPEKNPKFMVRLAEWFRNDENLFFVICGPGPLYDQLSLDIIEKRLRNIVMTGPVDSSEYLAISDLVIVPSILDGSPIVIKESLAMGIPVVASKVGGIPDLVVNGETGYVCDPDNLAVFASKIQKLSTSRALMMQMGRECRKYAVKHLDISRVWDKYLQVFKSVINTE